MENGDAQVTVVPPADAAPASPPAEQPTKEPVKEAPVPSLETSVPAAEEKNEESTEKQAEVVAAAPAPVETVAVDAALSEGNVLAPSEENVPVPSEEVKEVVLAPTEEKPESMDLDVKEKEEENKEEEKKEEEKKEEEKKEEEKKEEKKEEEKKEEDKKEEEKKEEEKKEEEKAEPHKAAETEDVEMKEAEEKIEEAKETKEEEKAEEEKEEAKEEETEQSGRRGRGRPSKKEPKQVKRPAQEPDEKPAAKRGRTEKPAVSIQGQHPSHQVAGSGRVLAAEPGQKVALYEALKEIEVRQVACGDAHGAAVATDGKVYTWGASDDGALGHGPKGFGAVAGGLQGKEGLQVACGGSHTLVLTADGAVYLMGAFKNGKEEMIGSAHTSATEVYSNPRDPCLKVTSGAQHAALLTQHGKVLTFGCGEHGRLGRLGPRTTRQHDDILLNPSEARIPRRRGVKGNDAKAVDVFCGPASTFVVMGDGVMFAFGAGGQIGVEDGEDQHVPVQATLLDGKKVAAVAAGEAYVVAADTAGHVWACGKGAGGVLGTGNETDTETENGNHWVEVTALSGKGVTALATGGNACFALTNEGPVYGWGDASKLGTGASGTQATPTQLNELGGKLLSVDAGKESAAFVVAV